EPIIPKSTGETQTSSTNLLKAEENNIDTDVLQEIKHLKSMIEHQAFRTTSNYLPDYQFAYQHLIDQEVDVQLAQEIMDTVLKQYTQKEHVITKTAITNTTSPCIP